MQELKVAKCRGETKVHLVGSVHDSATWFQLNGKATVTQCFVRMIPESQLLVLLSDLHGQQSKQLDAFGKSQEKAQLCSDMLNCPRAAALSSF